MSNLIYKLIICTAFALPEASAELVFFKSPDESMTISFLAANKVGLDWGEKNIDKLVSISLSKNSFPPLWTGVSYQDETGFPPQVIWGKNSKVALFLYRPQRSEVVIGVFRPDSEIKYESVLSEVDLNSWTAAVSDDQSYLKKMWTENWKEVEENIYEGDLVIGVSINRRFHLRITTTKVPSVVTVLSKE